MTFTAPALFFGLGARILLEKFSAAAAPDPAAPPAIGDHVFAGVWQGVGLYYVLTELPQLALVVALAIGAKLVYDYALLDVDLTRSACTLLGVALGVLVTDVLSQLVEDAGDSRILQLSASPKPAPSSRERDRSRRERERERERGRERRLSITAPPSISLASTSGTVSTIDPHGVMTPLEREVAELRARASLADTERRRFKEERKWALSMGNKARASQMAWQVKRYAALMESFNREADAKLIQAARLRGNPRDGPSQGNRVEIPSNKDFVVSTGRSDVRFELRKKR
ncbi:hypothetical protein GLOTRDRAFT_137646 [Gloeophyllum trabeum ATCC 11539]|uniref:Uncharacterized protein n=1 Tax=Gloeophyllum trabeum (strain ATCC 11539 / FP-39264 / Madison 617) TaxID=670483 RepID=S7QD70_GLOTA|nr:uncharacterized protein GLOTRDRAFT_137646 [Gloeophyllum trabeum ATCC 11539]EPQ57287.1 hypothetical protein GLOTRDRAFT_137646 [Gloeophyllum trabeum ATCC 11539]